MDILWTEPTSAVWAELNRPIKPSCQGEGDRFLTLGKRLPPGRVETPSFRAVDIRIGT
jgi:hypothetical protein